MGKLISKEEKPVDIIWTVNCMKLPDEIWLKIMGYLSTNDILKMAKVSKKFYGLSQDQNFIIKQLEFKSREFTFRWMFLWLDWSEERKA